MDDCPVRPAGELAGAACVPCEGGVPRYSEEAAARQIALLPGWHLTHGSTRVRRDWKARSFVDAMAFLHRVAELAEAERHHPDLHLEGYRKVWIEIHTHAIGGLSENDFILAAKIDALGGPEAPRPRGEGNA
ncbi:MAG: 4a-hydroxytetrahydrobiopterin dehydratase [Planctomycetaceae bacterium]